MILAIALIAVAVLVVVPDRTSSLFQDAICRIIRLIDKNRDCGGDDRADREKFLPAYCVRHGSKEHYAASVDIGFFTLGQDYSYVKETLSDGRVVVTFVPRTEAGLTAGVGWDFGAKNAVSTSAKVEGGVKAHLAPGMTYFLDNEEQYQKFKDEIDAAIAQETNRMVNPRGQAGLAIADLLGVYEPPEIREPTVRTGTIGLERTAHGSLGLWLGRGSKGRHAKEKDPVNMNLGAEGNVSVRREVDVSTWYDEKDNTKKSTTYWWSAEGDLGVDLLTERKGVDASWKGGTRVMRNEDGSLKNIRYTTTVSYGTRHGIGGRGETGKGNTGKNGGGGKSDQGDRTAVTQSVQIDFDTPEEQRIGEEMLKKRGLVPPGNVLEYMANPLMDEKDGGTINQKPDADAPAWEKLFYDQGRAWQYKERVRSEENEISAEAKLGLQLGVSFGWGMERRNTREAQILDAPANGERRLVDFPPCVSKKAGN